MLVWEMSHILANELYFARETQFAATSLAVVSLGTKNIISVDNGWYWAAAA